MRRKTVSPQDEERKLINPSNYSAADTNVDRNILVGSLGSVATSTWNGTVATVIYHHTDHLGGTHVETDGNGATVEYIIYSPFGGTLVDVQTGAYENKHKYTGKEKDVDTGWYYYGARYYNAERGVFLSEDPVFLEMGTHSYKDEQSVALSDPQLANSYSYSRNNPITYKDPDGRFLPIMAGIAAALAAAPEMATIGAALAVGGAGLTAVVADRVGTAISQQSSATDRVGATLDLATFAMPVMGVTRSVEGVASAVARTQAATTVYSAVRDGVTVYVGRTTNYAARSSRHLAERGLVTTPILQTTAEAGRGAEQILINAYGLAKNGGTLLNKINGISPSNPNLARYIDAGAKALESIK